MRKEPREEQVVFNELAALCSLTGYAHAIAYFCYRDNTVRFGDKITVDDTKHLFSGSRLIRAEISTLIGLMARSPIDFSIPAPETLQSYIDRTEALLHELHEALSFVWLRTLKPDEILTAGIDVLTTGDSLREPIFYGGESAYSFQYRDFSGPKYESDNDWLETNKGFRIEEAVRVITAIGRYHLKTQNRSIAELKSRPVGEWTFLNGLIFTAAEIAAYSGFEAHLVERVLRAFAMRDGDFNVSFQTLNDFNATSALPLLKHPSGFLLFQYYSLVEALYESPFYWMGSDKAYAPRALAHRGRFTENISRKMLERVFDTRVHANVDLVRKKGEKVSEIDTLCIFGEYAIILQAKSKRLTASARKGNDFQIQDDFKKAVQDACDQAALCANALTDPECRLIGPDGIELQHPTGLRRIYPVCVVADHYPALSFQARHFLKFVATEQIPPPLVTDVFALDVMTEMLRSPLRFLHYLGVRARFGEKLGAMHELTLLGYHLKGNLWVDDQYDMVMLEDDLAADLDLAMMVRREGLPGNHTPEGILTKLKGTTIGRFIDQIEQTPDERVVALGILFLNLAEDTLTTISKMIERIAGQARSDGKVHDMSAAFDELSSGVTIHCPGSFDSDLLDRLRAHCLMRKYSRKAQTWFGIIVRPDDLGMMVGLQLNFPWEHDDATEQFLQKMSAGLKPEDLVDVLDSPLLDNGERPPPITRQQRRARERARKKAARSRKAR